ncbi:MAG TPA: trypsin-like peptidase domain-containing protein [Gaiellaceae bacterium]|nr:trypsin-like peptidase domain-containing protein [Gaiellaceae bacterium]
MSQETFRRWARRGAPAAVALALGAGVGAAIYAAVGGGSGGSTATAVVPAQPAVSTQTVSSLTQLYKDVTPGVVEITVTGTSGPNFFGGQQQTQSEGSGFVVDTKGDIVTNAHVVDGGSSYSVRFQNGKTVSATLVGADDGSDIAVIKVNVPSSDLHPLTFGDSSQVQPGQEVVAIGSPFGLPGTMTAGIVSAIDRTITAPNRYSIAGAIQTDAPINHGNSGGPLLTTSGDVIGVNAQIDSDSGGNDGVGFALAGNAVKSAVDTLISGGKVQHAYIGISVNDAANNGGATVERVVAGSPAASAGLKAGDVITKIDDKSITSADDLTAVIGGHAPNDKVTVTLTRDGATKTIDVTLGTRPS